MLLVCMKPDDHLPQRLGHMAVCGWDLNYGGGWGEFNRFGFPATHWMPLPAPPEVA